MRTRFPLAFVFCSSLLACGDGGGSSSPSDAGSPSAEDAGSIDAGEPEDYTDLSAAVLAKYEECDYREPDLSDAEYSVEDSFDACLARCLLDASCDELQAAACDPSASGTVGECLDACQPSLSLPGGFACANGRSIPHAFVCDLEADCPDGEDEEGCGTFTCGNGRVLPARSVRCDQIEDCADGSDELGCKLSC